MVVTIYGISKYRYIYGFNNMRKCIRIRDSAHNMYTLHIHCTPILSQN